MHINSTTTTTITDGSSFINNQEPKETHGRIICVIPLEELENLLNEQKEQEQEKQALKETQKLLNEEKVQLMKKNLLPQEEWGLILPYLHHKDIIATSRCFATARKEMCDHRTIMYNAWFSLFTKQQQAAFEKFIKKMSEAETYRWMCQFETEKSIKTFLTKKPSAKALLFTRSLSMRNCPIFKVEEKRTIAHPTPIRSATFSTDGLQLVITTNRPNLATIYVKNSSGKWTLKLPTTLCVLESAIFSTDNSHMIAIHNTHGSHTATIYGQDSRGKWIEETIIPYPAGDAFSATLSADSLHAMLVSQTSTEGIVEIFGQDSNGKWTQRALIKNELDSTTGTNSTKAIFSPDGRKVCIIDHNCVTQIYEQNSSADTWTKTATVAPNKTTALATFSADSRHVAIIHKNQSAGIYGQNPNGKWAQKILINNNSSSIRRLHPLKPTFSNNGRFAMIAYDNSRAVTICEQSSDGKWTKKATMQYKTRIESISFSPDSCHAVTSDYGGTVTLYSKMANNQWQKTATSLPRERQVYQNYRVSPFSADSRQILIASTKFKAINIFTWTSNKQWINSHVTNIDADKDLQEATFSADGSHVIIVATDIVKIYGPKTKDDTVNKKAHIESASKNHTWKEKAHMNHTGVDTARMSADGGHVVTVNRSYATTKIWRLSLE